MIPDHMQPSFRMEDLYNNQIAIPPKEEQQSIATYLDGATAQFDSLIEEAEQQVCLLQERCSALISAAVTGKIDVRHYTPKEAHEPAHRDPLRGRDRRVPRAARLAV